VAAEMTLKLPPVVTITDIILPVMLRGWFIWEMLADGK
jgi:hypothetical protein